MVIVQKTRAVMAVAAAGMSKKMFCPPGASPLPAVTATDPPVVASPMVLVVPLGSAARSHDVHVAVLPPASVSVIV